MNEKDIHALNCPNCGAPVRVGTCFCPYCGSGIRFVGDENLMHVEIVHAKVDTLNATMSIGLEMLDCLPEREIERFVKRDICNKIARHLFDYIDFKAMRDIKTGSVLCRGRLRVAHPRSDATDCTIEIGRIKRYDELQFGTDEYVQ